MQLQSLSANRKKKVLLCNSEWKYTQVYFPFFQYCTSHRIQLIMLIVSKPRNDAVGLIIVKKPEPRAAGKNLDRRARHSPIALLCAIMRLKPDATFRNRKPADSFARRCMNSRISTPGWCDSFHSRCQRRREARWAAASLLPGRSPRWPCAKQTAAHQRFKETHARGGEKKQCPPVSPRRLSDEITCQSYLTIEQRACVILTH